MSEEKESLILGGKKFISSKRASEVSGYTADYIGQLARAGKVESQLIGRTRFVEERSLLGHKASVEESSSVWKTNTSSVVTGDIPSKEDTLTFPPAKPATQAVGFRVPMALSVLGLMFIFASFTTGYSSPRDIADLWSDTGSRVGGVFNDLSDEAIEVRKNSLASIILIDRDLQREDGEVFSFPTHSKVSGQTHSPVAVHADGRLDTADFIYEGYVEAGVMLSGGAGEIASRASESFANLFGSYFKLSATFLDTYSRGAERSGEKVLAIATSHFANTSSFLAELAEARDIVGAKLYSASEEYVEGVFVLGDEFIGGIVVLGEASSESLALYLGAVDILKDSYVASIENLASLTTLADSYVAGVSNLLVHVEKGIGNLGEAGADSVLAYLGGVEDLKSGYYGLVNGTGENALSLASGYVELTGEFLTAYGQGLAEAGERAGGTAPAYISITDKVTGGYYALISETGESFVSVLSSSGSLAFGLKGSYDGAIALVAEKIESDGNRLSFDEASIERSMAAGAYLSFGDGLGSLAYAGAEAYLRGVESLFENYTSGIERAGEEALKAGVAYVSLASSIGDVPVSLLTGAGEELYEFSEAYVDAVFDLEGIFARGLNSTGDAVASIYVPSVESKYGVAGIGFLERITEWAVSTFQKIVDASKSHLITNTARNSATTTTPLPAQSPSPASIEPVAEVGEYVPPPPDYLRPVAPAVTRVVEREIAPVYIYTNGSDLLLQKIIELQKQLSSLAVGGNFDVGEFVTRDMLGRYFDKYSDSGGDSPSINWESVSITGGTISGVSSLGGTNATFSGTVTAGSFMGDGSGLINVSGVGTSTLIADSDADTKIQVEESSDEDVIRFDTAGSERVVILANGMVGIGTTSPSAKLSVSGSAGENPFLVHSGNLNKTFLSIDEDGRVGIGTPNLVGTTGDLTISRNNSSSEGYIYFGSASASLQYTGGFSFTDTLTIQKSNSPGLVVKETGNSYEGRFSVAGSAGLFSDLSTAGDSVLSASHGDLILSARNGSGGVLFGTGAADTEKVRITSGGFLGVGTTSPYAKLSVAGDFALTGGLYDNNSTKGTAGQVLQSTGTGLNWVATSSLGITSDPGGSDTQVQFNDGGDFGGSSDFTWNNTSKILSLGATTATTQLVLPRFQDRSTPTLAFGDGDTGIHEAAANLLRINYGGGSTVLDFGASGLQYRTNANIASTIFKVTGSGVTVGENSSTAQLLLPLSNDAVTPTLAFGDGDTGFYESADDTLTFAAAGSARWYFGSTAMGAVDGQKPGLLYSNPSATFPNIVPYQNDGDTGLGRDATSGGLRLIDESVSVLEALNNGTSNTVSIFGTAGQAANYLNLTSSGGTAGNIFNVSSTGNVGIGTVSPHTKLWIQGATTDSISFNDSTATSLITLSGSDTANVRMQMGVGHSSIGPFGSWIQSSFDNGADEGAKPLLLNPVGGSVGIGGSAPGSQLSVYGNVTIGASYGTTVAPTNGLLVEGNVGIGTDSPSGILHLKSSEVTPQLWIESTATNSNPSLVFANDSQLWTIRIHGSAGNDALAINDASTGADIVKIETGAPDEVLRISSSGNIGIGTTVFGTSAAKVLALGNATAPSTSIADGIQIYAEDVAASSELKVRDEAGNITTLSPHNFSLIEDGPSEPLAWSFFSERDGRKLNVDMLKAVRLVEALSGEKLVHGNLKAFEGEGAFTKIDLKLKDIEAKVTALQARQTESMSVFDGIADYLESFGVRLSASVAWFKNIVTDTLTVGSETNPTGITLYDEITGEPYCVKVSSGQMVNIPGKCDNLPRTPNILNPEALEKNKSKEPAPEESIEEAVEAEEPAEVDPLEEPEIITDEKTLVEGVEITEPGPSPE